MCSTTHLHLEEFASMSQTSISVTFWPSIQRQQSACKMFHVPFLWWLYTALLPELTRISIAIPPHSGKPSEVLFLPRWSDRNESRKTPKDTVNRSIVLSDVEPGDAYHWHSLAWLQSHFAEIGNSMEWYGSKLGTSVWMLKCWKCLWHVSPWPIIYPSVKNPGIIVVARFYGQLNGKYKFFNHLFKALLKQNLYIYDNYCF